jgi:hypothetical protein
MEILEMDDVMDRKEYRKIYIGIVEELEELDKLAHML